MSSEPSEAIPMSFDSGFFNPTVVIDGFIAKAKDVCRFMENYYFTQGGPKSWWNHMHNQHHAKPNCFRKDPDLNMHPVLFTLGKTLSVEVSRTDRVLRSGTVKEKKEWWGSGRKMEIWNKSNLQKSNKREKIYLLISTK